MTYDVIIVGAGPAGSSAAYFLACRGRRVLLLDRARFPRDKSCGDGLTRPALHILDEMELLERFADAQKVAGARVFMRGKGSRDFLYPAGKNGSDYGLVVPRRRLDAVLCAKAVEAGAELWEGALVTGLIKRNGRFRGVHVTRQGQELELTAPVTIAADGAASRLAAQAGLAKGVSFRLGFALRGYFAGLRGPCELLEIYMPLMDSTDRYILPSYGWVFPTGPGSANIGVGIFERTPGVTVRDLLERFLAELRERDPRFEKLQPNGAPRGAPLNFEFRAERCVMRGLILAGDAAGLISPFTGEGISYALESGKIAAEAIDRNLRPGLDPDLSDYAVMLEKRYMGYFEAGRQGARRYRLIWHVLESTFHNERPLFVLCRRAALLPEAVGETDPAVLMDDVSGLIERGDLRVREDLLAVGETLLSIMRRDWPFLARFSPAGHGDPGVPFRPALLLLLAAAFGNNSDGRIIPAAAAVELGYLAALAHLSVEDSGPIESANGGRPANWGNMLSLMVGDFFLSKAYEFSAGCGAEVSEIIAESLGQVSEARVRSELLQQESPEVAELQEQLDIQQVSAIFELPCRLGAVLSGLEAGSVLALSRYGVELGAAFRITDEVLQLYGRASQLGQVLASTTPVFHNRVLRRAFEGRPAPASWDGLASWPTSLEILEAVERSEAATACVNTARAHAARAIEALSPLVDDPARRTLAKLAAYAVNRDPGVQPDLRSSIE